MGKLNAWLHHKCVCICVNGALRRAIAHKQSELSMTLNHRDLSCKPVLLKSFRGLRVNLVLT